MNYRTQCFATIALLTLLSAPVMAETLPEFRPALLGSFSRFNQYD